MLGSKPRGVECLGVGMCMAGMQCQQEGTPNVRCVMAGMVDTGNPDPNALLPPQCASGAFQRAKDDSDTALQAAGCGPDSPFGKVRPTFHSSLRMQERSHCTRTGK
jgi:hypothetical protein